MSKIELIDKAIFFIKELNKLFSEQQTCGKVIIEINYFKGGITSISKNTAITEK